MFHDAASASETRTVAVISFAEKPIHLIRGIHNFRAGAGVQLQKGDILESGPIAIQIEIGPSLMMAVAPDSRLYIAEVGSKLAVNVLTGWVKLHVKSSDPGELSTVQSSLMRANAVVSTFIFHTDDKKSELFVEEGALAAIMPDASTKGPELKVNQEQFVVRAFELPLKVLARPSKEFLSAMPKVFRDALSSSLAKLNGKSVVPIKEQEVQYADIDVWLKSDMPMKKELVKRFMPLSKNPEFRKSLDLDLGQSPEWKPILHPPVKKTDQPKLPGSIIY